MLTGQAAMFCARMPVGGVIQRMPRPVFRQLMSEAPELSDVILKAFMARREFQQLARGERLAVERGDVPVTLAAVVARVDDRCPGHWLGGQVGEVLDRHRVTHYGVTTLDGPE